VSQTGDVDLLRTFRLTRRDVRPDALCADSISDVVRILTISDIFSALIEDRRYREPMPREDAYDILCRMQGKLEKPLVATFRQVALHR